MRIPKKYSGIFEETRKIGIRDRKTLELIKTYREEYFGEPVSLSELLEALE